MRAGAAFRSRESTFAGRVRLRARLSCAIGAACAVLLGACAPDDLRSLSPQHSGGGSAVGNAGSSSAVVGSGGQGAGVSGAPAQSGSSAGAPSVGGQTSGSSGSPSNAGAGAPSGSGGISYGNGGVAGN